MARKRKELARRFCCPIISRRLLWRFFSLISVYEFVRAARRAKRSRLKSTYNARFLHSLPPNNLIFYHFFSFSLSDCLHISFAFESFHRIRVMKWTEKVLAGELTKQEMINSKVSFVINFFLPHSLSLSFSNYATFTICFSFFHRIARIWVQHTPQPASPVD